MFRRTLILFAVLVRCPGQEAPIKVDVNVVNVLCTVHDKRGTLVQDLAKEDFEVFENGRRQDLRYFARDTDLPLTVALLVDVSGSVRWVIRDEKDAAAAFLKAILRKSDQAMLLGFSSTLILWQDFTSSVPRLEETLGRVRAIPFRGLPALGQPMPGTLLYDAVYQTATNKLVDISGRKAMVIISDGLDNGSRMHLDEAIRTVQATDTIVYGICYESGFSGCSLLKSLAEPTGGRMFEAGKKLTLPEIFRMIEDELRTQYALGYVPANKARDGSYRRLQVKVRRSALKVRARKGYFAINDGAAGK
jgi:VWFA-related protein